MLLCIHFYNSSMSKLKLKKSVGCVEQYCVLHLKSFILILSSTSIYPYQCFLCVLPIYFWPSASVFPYLSYLLSTEFPFLQKHPHFHNLLKSCTFYLVKSVSYRKVSNFYPLQWGWGVVKLKFLFTYWQIFCLETCAE